MKNISHLIFVLLFVTSCSSDSETQLHKSIESVYIASLTELSDQEYPDNPDISVRHNKYIHTNMSSIEFIKSEGAFNIVITPKNDGDDTVKMMGIRLMEFIPTIPECSKGDEYMSLISIVNQEWNRNQVKWVGEDLKRISPVHYSVNNEEITRIDLARNCLNSYLWELFLIYTSTFLFFKKRFQTKFPKQFPKKFSKQFSNRFQNKAKTQTSK